MPDREHAHGRGELLELLSSYDEGLLSLKLIMGRKNMHLRAIFTSLAACGCLALSSPLLAEQTQAKPAKDPNEKICEKQTIVGSRLATRRVCATRAEWAETRRLDKEAVDQGQRSACMISHTGASGRPGC